MLNIIILKTLPYDKGQDGILCLIFGHPKQLKTKQTGSVGRSVRKIKLKSINYTKNHILLYLILAPLLT